MIDVIIPAKPENASHVVFQTLTGLADNTDIPLRIIVSAQGGTKDDWELVRQFLDTLRCEQEMHYGLMLRERHVFGPLRAVADAVEHVKHDYVLVIRSEVVLKDSQWFAKMVSPLQRAPYVGGVFLPYLFSGSSTLDPNSLNDQSSIYQTSGVLTTRAHLEMVNASKAFGGNGEEFDTWFQTRVVQHGCTRWMHSGVNFKRNNEAAWFAG